MTDWIHFEEGQYAVSSAYLINTENSAADLQEPVLEIYTGRLGKRQMKGYGLVQNTALVELHEDGDSIDLLLDLGEDFQFLMENPILQAGKVFSPGVRSLVHFYPRKPWHPLSAADFEALRKSLEVISV